MRKQKGFTLIELLVVIAIIGLLSTLAVVSLSNARQKARDTRRVSDVKQIQMALELYYNDQNAYPAAVTSAGTIAGGTPSVTYMAVVPSNPQPGGSVYTYVGCTDATCPGTAPYNSYTLSYTLEGASGGIPVGLHRATPAGLANP